VNRPVHNLDYRAGCHEAIILPGIRLGHRIRPTGSQLLSTKQRPITERVPPAIHALTTPGRSV